MATQSLIPRWARIPTYVQAKDVVATNKGWKLKATGELLVSFHNLDERLKQLQNEINFSVEHIENKSDKQSDKKETIKPDVVINKPEIKLPIENTTVDKDVTIENIVKNPTPEDLEALAKENDTEDEDIGALSIAPLSAESINLEVNEALNEALKKEENKKANNKRKPKK